jgi:hypothetical protein
VTGRVKVARSGEFAGSIFQTHCVGNIRHLHYDAAAPTDVMQMIEVWFPRAGARLRLAGSSC